MTKKGAFFGPQNVPKSRRAKTGLPSTGPLSSTEQKGKDCHDQDKQVQEASFGFVFDMIFGDGVGTFLVGDPYCRLRIGLMRFYIGTAQLKKMRGAGFKPDLQEAPDSI